MILLPNEILNMEHHINVENSQKVYRYGIEMEKGAVMSEDRFEKHRDLYEKYFNLWINYPDLFLDFIKPTNSKFKLYFYQRLFLRLAMRYARLFVIAPRALITRRTLKALNCGNLLRASITFPPLANFFQQLRMHEIIHAAATK